MLCILSYASLTKKTLRTRDKLLKPNSCLVRGLYIAINICAKLYLTFDLKKVCPRSLLFWHEHPTILTLLKIRAIFRTFNPKKKFNKIILTIKLYVTN